MIVGNKLDVGDAPPPSGGKGAREVSTEEGERYAGAKRCLFLGEYSFLGWGRLMVRLRKVNES